MGREKFVSSFLAVLLGLVGFVSCVNTPQVFAAFSSDKITATTTLVIPNSTSCDANAQGELCQDTTDDQLVYGSTPRVLRYEEEKCAIIQGLSDLDSTIVLGSFIDAVTITNVWCHCIGTCDTLATFDLQDGSGNVMSHSDPVCAVENGTATAQAVTSGGLSARELLEASLLTAPSPYTDTYSICWSYTVDRQ